MTPSAVAPGPVLVGGTGRSGTTITGRLIGQHSQYHCIPVETRFQTVLPNLVSGRMSFDEYRVFFDQNVTHRFDGLLPQGVVDDALEQLRAGLDTDRVAAARQLFHSLLDPIAADAGKPAWVEMTPASIMCASALVEILPDAKIIHAVRDGRDVASSVSAKWGRMSPLEALDWWESRMAKIVRQLRNLPPSTFTTIRLETLIRDDREGALERLLEHLGLPAEPALQEWFDTEMQPEHAHIGRWREGLSPARQGAFTKRYSAILNALGPDANSGLADLREALDGEGRRSRRKPRAPRGESAAR